MVNNINSCKSGLPLVVDLDGTLIKTDLLFESANQFISRNPFSILSLLAWLANGRAYLKGRLARSYLFDPSSLPYNQNLIAWLFQEHKKGRELVLATGSHMLLASKVASHLGFFDDVWATEGEVNLKSIEKLDLLVGKYGVRGFDYVGNDYSDLLIWKVANKAYVVNSGPIFVMRLLRLDSMHNLAHIFLSERPLLILSIFKVLRLHQWLKNILIFVPLLAAQQFIDTKSNIQALFAFGIFSLTASSLYLINDLIDVEDDRHHHSKQYRPFAAGNLSLGMGWLLWPLFLLISFGLAWLLLDPAFMLVLAIYFVVTLAYSLQLKKIVIIDTLTLAILYTLRIVAGAASIAVPLSFWILTFSMFIFLSLAFIKRFSELKSARQLNQDQPLPGRGYQQQDLELVSTMGIGSGYIAVLVLAFYIQDRHTSELYSTPQFIWLACPVLLFWISRAWLITHRGQMHDDPIIFAIKDCMSWIVGFAFLGVFALAKIF